MGVLGVFAGLAALWLALFRLARWRRRHRLARARDGREPLGTRGPEDEAQITFPWPNPR